MNQEFQGEIPGVGSFPNWHEASVLACILRSANNRQTEFPAKGMQKAQLTHAGLLLLLL